MEFKYKIPEKFQPLRKEQIWESWDKYEGLEETYHKLGAYEYEQIKDYVPQNPRAVLECGCVDRDTEFLTPTGWVSMSDFNNHEIMVFNPATGTSHHEVPQAYIKLPCSEFFHIKTKYGLDQMLSSEHRVLYYRYDGTDSWNRPEVISMEDLFLKHTTSGRNGFRGRIPTTFDPTLKTKNPLSDELLRVMVMVCADGYYQNKTDNRVKLSFRKERKVKRCLELIEAAGLEYQKYYEMGGLVTRIHVRVPIKTKTLNFWDCSLEQLKIITDEVMFWDGDQKNRFSTTNKETADFVQYAFAATGRRSSMFSVDRKRGHSIEYIVNIAPNTKVGIQNNLDAIHKVPSSDGYKYCFTVSTGFFVIRRNGKIAITGNSGLGRGSIYLNHILGSPKRTIWVLADRDGFSEENTGAFKPKKDEFYNDLALTEEFAVLNGMPALRTSTFDTEKEDWEEFNGCFDFIFSFCSFGMHVEIERYIDRLIGASSPDVTMIFGTRHAGYNDKSFADRFKEVIFLPSKGQAPFPIENWLILRGLK